MSILDWVLIAAIGLALGWAVWVCIRNRRKGKTCTGDCASCGCNCGK